MICPILLIVIATLLLAILIAAIWCVIAICAIHARD